MKDEDKREEASMGELEGLPKRSAELEDMANKPKANKSELEHLFNLSVDMLCVADLDGYFTLINHAFEKTLGYTKEELLKEPFLSFVHPDDQASTVEAMKELSRGEPVIRFENRYQCKDGSYKWLAWSAMPVPEKGVTYAVAREVTGLKQVEQSLRESELWMKSIFNSLEEAVFVVTPDRKMVNVNDAAQRMFGYLVISKTVPLSWSTLIMSITWSLGSGSRRRLTWIRPQTLNLNARKKTVKYSLQNTPFLC